MYEDYRSQNFQVRRMCCAGVIWLQYIVPYLLELRFPRQSDHIIPSPRHTHYTAGCSAQSELFFRLLLKNTVRWAHSPAYPFFWTAPHRAQPNVILTSRRCRFRQIRGCPLIMASGFMGQFKDYHANCWIYRLIYKLTVRRGPCR
jgi:hypothetical protein